MRSLIVGLDVLGSPSLLSAPLSVRNTKVPVCPTDSDFLCLFISYTPKVVADLSALGK